MVNDIKEEANSKDTDYSNQAYTENSTGTIKNNPEDTSTENISQKEKLIIDKLKELFDAVEYKIN